MECRGERSPKNRSSHLRYGAQSLLNAPQGGFGGRLLFFGFNDVQGLWGVLFTALSLTAAESLCCRWKRKLSQAPVFSLVEPFSSKSVLINNVFLLVQVLFFFLLM